MELIERAVVALERMADLNAEHLATLRVSQELQKRMLGLQEETAAANREARAAAVTLQRVSDRSWAMPAKAGGRRPRGR